jgi:hypothetical protein
VQEQVGEDEARVRYQGDGEEVGEGFEDEGFADCGAVLLGVGDDGWVCGGGFGEGHVLLFSECLSCFETLRGLFGLGGWQACMSWISLQDVVVALSQVVNLLICLTSSLC